MSRRRPLHTCGASVLAIIHTACRKAQELNGPLGTLAKRVTKSTSLALPLMFAVQYQWLAILSFTDDRILTFEKLVETIFPPSTLLFDKIDKLVYTAEIMPGKFDEALNRFPVIMHRVPFLDWALMQIIWWLNFLISILTHSGWENMEEKEIMIDMSSNTTSNVTESADNANCPSQKLPSVSCPPQEKIFEVGKPESNAVLPAGAKSENKEKLPSVLDSMENEVKTDSAKYTVESSTSNESGNLISAPLVDSSQDKSKSVDRVEFPSTAAAPREPSQDKSTAALPGDPSQDKSKSVDHVEFPSIAAPPGDSSQDKSIPVDHVELPNTAKKEEPLPPAKILEDDASKDETKSIGVKLESDIVKGTNKERIGKLTKADNAQEESQQSEVSEEKVGKDKEKDKQKSVEETDKKDPVLELFESRWHL